MGAHSSGRGCRRAAAAAADGCTRRNRRLATSSALSGTCGQKNESRHTSHVTRLMSHVTNHKSHATHHTSNLTHYKSCDTRHLLAWLFSASASVWNHSATCNICITRNTQNVTHQTQQVTRHTSHAKRYTSHVTRHTPNVTRHTSHVTRHTSHVTRHNHAPHTSSKPSSVAVLAMLKGRKISACNT